MKESTIDSRQWVVDLGATNHMTPNRAAFVSYNRIKHVPIHLANGSTTPAIAVGDIEFCLARQGPASPTKVKSVYHVPRLSMSLLLTKQLGHKGISFTSYLDGGVLTRNGKTIG